MSVRAILEAAVEAGFDSRLPPQWTALVVLVEQDSGGNPDAVSQHFEKAKRYPGWSPVDLARYSARIAIRTPVVTYEMSRLGIEAVGEAVESITEPLVEIARGPLRMLQWLQDPGTQLRILKVVIGGVMIVGGLFLAVRPHTNKLAGQIVKVAAATPQGKGAKVAATAAAAKG